MLDEMRGRSLVRDTERSWHVGGGIALILTGLGFAIGAIRFDLGSISDMGPGFLPMCLGILLLVLGGVETLDALSRHNDDPPQATNWKATIWVSAAMLAFGLLVEIAGLDPAVFVASLLAMLGERPVRPARVLLVSLGITILADVLFIRLLSISVSAFGG